DGDARDITPRLGETGHYARSDGITAAEENDGNRFRRSFKCEDSGRPSSKDRVHFLIDQLPCELGKALCLSLGKTILDENILSLNVVELAERLDECIEISVRRRAEQQHTDARCCCLVLRGGQIPGHHSHETDDQKPQPSYS